MAEVFGKWRSGLAKTSKTAFGRLATLLGVTEITQETWDDLEALLIQADLGIETTSEILDVASSPRSKPRPDACRRTFRRAPGRIARQTGCTAAVALGAISHR